MLASDMVYDFFLLVFFPSIECHEWPHPLLLWKECHSGPGYCSCGKGLALLSFIPNCCYLIIFLSMITISFLWHLTSHHFIVLPQSLPSPSSLFQNHYRNYRGKRKCVLEKDFVTEKRLWHFKDKLIPRVAKAYYQLGLYRNVTIK